MRSVTNPIRLPDAYLPSVCDDLPAFCRTWLSDRPSAARV